MTPVEIVDSFRLARRRGDFVEARRWLHDDLRVHWPLGTFDRQERYLESLRRRHQSIERIELIATWGEGEEVCVIFDLVLREHATPKRVAELYSLRV